MQFNKILLPLDGSELAEAPLALAIIGAVDTAVPVPTADEFETFTGRGVRAA